MSADPSYLLSRGYKARLLGLLLAVCALNFTDRILVPVLAQPLKQELALSDFQLGLLTGLGFALVYTCLGIPVAWLADRFNRVRILAAAVVIWSTMTAATGFATSFVHLLIARAGVGVGEAGFLPPTASLLSDHFAANRRASAMAIVQLGSPASTILGAVLAAWIASQWGWRSAFIVVGLPGILIGLLLLAVLREPPRGLADGIAQPVTKPPLRQVLGTILSKPSFRHLMAGGALAMFGLSSVGGFMTAYFMRVHALPLGEAGTLFGVIQFVAAVAGLLAGGFGSDRLAAGDPRWRAWGPAVCLALAAPCYFIGFASDSLVLAGGAILVGGVFFFFFYVPTLTLTQNLVGPQSRATAIAVYSLAASIVGSGFGPTLTGLASDLFARGAFAMGDFSSACPGGIAPEGSVAALASACSAAAAHGVRAALLLVALLYLWAAFHFWMVGRTLARDLHQPSA